MDDKTGKFALYGMRLPRYRNDIFIKFRHVELASTTHVLSRVLSKSLTYRLHNTPLLPRISTAPPLKRGMLVQKL
jgi:hypothetical protein